MIKNFVKALKQTSKTMGYLLPDKSEKIPKETIFELLLESDLSYESTEELTHELPDIIGKNELRYALYSRFFQDATQAIHAPITLILGINGAGKTTTTAKLAKLTINDGKTAMLAAADTFRAAAVEQLTLWANKLDVPIIANKDSKDAASIAYNAVQSFKAKSIDKLFIDTAGRLHTSTNLLEELKKVVRVTEKAAEKIKVENIQKWLILDGTQGRSAINQAKEFHAAIGVDAIIITKLDGTAKGGALFDIAKQLKIPIAYIGIGEKMDDLIEFDYKEFTTAFLDGFYA